MKQPKIIASVKAKSSFYVQCKGNHSGRPLRESIPNCFSVICANEADEKTAWTIATALYHSEQLKVDIIGTAVPFIRVSAYRKHFYNSWSYCNEAAKYTESLEKMEKLEKNLTGQLKLIDQIKKALSFKFLSKKD